MADNGIFENGSRKRGRGRPRNADAAARSLATILNLVRTGAANTRQELERESELGRAIVADRLATLIGLQLADESAFAEAAGGRAPRLVQFNADRARVIVATLDQTAIGVGIADLSGTLLTVHHETLDLGEPPESTIARLCALFEWILEKEERSVPLWGIGISVPGPVRMAPGEDFLVTTPAFLPAWNGIPFVERLSVQFGAPVWMRSSVETMTVGELYSGDDAETSDMLFVKVGKRIGAGIVCDGQLYRGAQGSAGLIGQMPTTFGGRTAALDVLAGSDMITAEGLAAARDGSSPALADILSRGGDVTAIDVGQAAQMGDPVSMEIMARSGNLIGHVVAAFANMLNPSIIVLSGSVAQTNDILLAAVREAVYGESHPLVTRDLKIRASRLGSSAGLLGAAKVVIEALFDSDFLREWITLSEPTALERFRQTLSSHDRDKPPARYDPPAAPPHTRRDEQEGR
ncbi:ROK family protein [Acuticoccus sp. MNP-M23]|uniref:ROK family protein n=1 Tax=Acuticoccus sp. MNP-M23 TaxID=3072793 RepID=UPI0028163B41|nr:ROK family protein [Acuticoccus sp. MNP-M23]WMS43772.1 ROK family protein [Acuticoccus sp. MNP-M23]